jgi:glucokinase
MHPSSRRFPAVVADIGGSNARFGWLAAPGERITQIHKLPVADFAGLAQAMRAYLQRVSAALGPAYQRPAQAALAGATPITDDRVDLTNSHWSFSGAAVQAELELDTLLVLNDFEALALALPRLSAAQFRCHAAQPSVQGCMAVIGPGTGLGVAAVVQTAHGWKAVPGEGGHATLAPADHFEHALLAHVHRTYAHVSAERLLSGIGMPVLHGAVAQVLGAAAEAITTETIVERGLGGADVVCSRTLDVFCAMLGGFAGNVALTFGARGGVFIGGGIVPRLGVRFFASQFRERFEAKGRMRSYLETVPTSLITDTLAALSGAALAIEQQED